MPITKIKNDADLVELLADTDFRYVPFLSDSLKRVAAYYEYARESAELIEAAIELRESGTFKPGCKKRDVNPELTQKMAKGGEIYPITALCVLAECDDFPQKPFRVAVQNAEILKWGGISLGTSGPVDLPWHTVISLRNDLTRHGYSEMEFYDNWARRSNTLHAISIPWNYTNEELAAFFHDLIPRIRPREFPEPKKAGRRGRSSGSGATDMLNQLGAFRLNRTGWKFDPSCKLTRKMTPYGSVKGWKKAVHAAEERINNMTKRPFFG